MAILYTCGNTNLKTVKLVAIAIKTLTQKNGTVPVSKVVLFSSPATLKDNLFIEQARIYEEFLGQSIRIEKVHLSSDGLGNSEDFSAVFKDDNLKYVDLTNGQKASTAQLYLTASLLKIDRIYYISLLCQPQEIPNNPIWEKHYKYIKLPPFSGLSNLARLSYFDLMFYIEEIEKIFTGVSKDTFLSKMSNDLRKSIFSFFQGDNFRSAISDATTSSEVLINQLLYFLRDYPPAKRFSKDFGINLNQRDPLGAISFFFRKYAEEGSKNRLYSDKNLEPILTVPGLLSPLRGFRNMSAHSGISSHKFEANEARICINLALEIFRCLKASERFWERLLAQ